MAKLKGPLFSLGAAGQLGKTLVYFPWKGINAVRTYVIPANPQSDEQIIQRDYLKDGVTEWHGAAYSGDDVGAWNRYAGILAKIMSGFNSMIKTFVDEAILTNTWQRITGVTSANPHANDFEVECSMPLPGADPTCHYGRRKTHFPDSVVLDDLGGAKWGKTLDSLTKDSLYYFYIEHGSSGTDFGRTGIYSQRTAAA
ncbi:hypothetical protein ES703_85265 [subsurface metagenome]